MTLPPSSSQHFGGHGGLDAEDESGAHDRVHRSAVRNGSLQRFDIRCSGPQRQDCPRWTLSQKGGAAETLVSPEGVE
jgi:hypothetical protein